MHLAKVKQTRMESFRTGRLCAEASKDEVHKRHRVSTQVQAVVTRVSSPTHHYWSGQELIRMASYTSACTKLDTRPVVGMLIGTALKSETHYECRILKVSV